MKSARLILAALTGMAMLSQATTLSAAAHDRLLYDQIREPWQSSVVTVSVYPDRVAKLHPP